MVFVLFSASPTRANLARMTQDNDLIVESDVMVQTRDGIGLATDIYRPASSPGPFPVIIERTPYGKIEASPREGTADDPTPRPRSFVAEYFVRNGYAVVYQDCRGRHGSEGAFAKYLSEGEDGYDSIEWISKQPWCNGRIGTMGLSYAAHTQVAAACLNPPGLTCMLIDSGGFSNAYQSGIRQGGAFELKQATWALKQAALSPLAEDPVTAAALAAEDPRAWFAAMPWKQGHSPLKAVPEYETYLFEQWTHGEWSDYWRQLGIFAEGYWKDFADVPMLHISSWYDAYVRTATENYLGLKAAGKGPLWLLMGCWTHGDRSLRVMGDVDFGPKATLDGNLARDFFGFRLNWFDRWLKGVENGVEAEPPVKLFVMGGGSGTKSKDGHLEHGGNWRTFTDWPPPEAVPTAYHLHADGSLALDAPETTEASIAYDYDPRHPVPTIGGTVTSGEPLMVGGAFDQREGSDFYGSREPYLPLAARADVLVFETPTLDEDVVIAGPVTVTLFVSSNCPDTDFTAKLIDVHPASQDYPSGYAMNVTNGILRCRYRNSWEAPEMMQPGEIYEIMIEPFATANRFKAGHRIRLDISSSNYPHFDLNPNTGEPEGLWRRMRVATNRVHLDANRPSRVELSVVAASD